MLIGTEKSPKGPSFSKVRPIQKELSGTKLRFLAPPHKDPFSNLEHWEEEPDTQNIFDSSLYRALEVLSVEDGERQKFDEIRSLRIYSSRWEFRGLPLLQGYCGHMNMLVDVKEVVDLPINESLFDNSVLAREAYRHFDWSCLKNVHRGHTDDPYDFTPYRWASYLGPLNSQWLSKSGDWLYFEEQPLIRKDQAITWNIAIGDKHYLSFNFIIVRSARNAGNPYRIEQRVPRDNFLKLMHQIMDSLTLDLSPEAAALRARVQAQPGASDKPLLGFTPEQVEEAKHVLYMWSDREYEDSGKGEDDDHRASREEVAAFVDERIKPRPLPNSYPPGDLLKLSPQPFRTEPQTAQ